MPLHTLTMQLKKKLLHQEIGFRTRSRKIHERDMFSSSMLKHQRHKFLRRDPSGSISNVNVGSVETELRSEIPLRTHVEEMHQT